MKDNLKFIALLVAIGFAISMLDEIMERIMSPEVYAASVVFAFVVFGGYGVYRYIQEKSGRYRVENNENSVVIYDKETGKVITINPDEEVATEELNEENYPLPAFDVVDDSEMHITVEAFGPETYDYVAGDRIIGVIDYMYQDRFIVKNQSGEVVSENLVSVVTVEPLDGGEIIEFKLPAGEEVPDVGDTVSVIVGENDFRIESVTPAVP